MNKTIKNAIFGVDIHDGHLVKDQHILLGYRGSVAHGTHRPPTNPNSIDDIDIIGVVAMPLDYYLGLKRFQTREKWVGKYDMVFYDVRHYMSLLLKQNPNVHSLLWLRPQHYIQVTEMGELLIANRASFLSKEVYHAYAGYARSQLRKMENCACKGYMGAKRKALVEKFGYDTKNASHLIRILRQGIELLLSGEVTVYRPDFEELLEIKDGKFSLEQVKAMAEDLFKEANSAYLTSVLPPAPDYNKANQLLSEIILNHQN